MTALFDVVNTISNALMFVAFQPKTLRADITSLPDQSAFAVAGH